MAGAFKEALRQRPVEADKLLCGDAKTTTEKGNETARACSSQQVEELVKLHHLSRPLLDVLQDDVDDGRSRGASNTSTVEASGHDVGWGCMNGEFWDVGYEGRRLPRKRRIGQRRERSGFGEPLTCKENPLHPRVRNQEWQGHTCFSRSMLVFCLLQLA